jgi:hypothetical protein
VDEIGERGFEGICFSLKHLDFTVASTVVLLNYSIREAENIFPDVILNRNFADFSEERSSEAVMGREAHSAPFHVLISILRRVGTCMQRKDA